MQSINVSVVYATAEKQWLKEITVKRGTNAAELIAQSGLLAEVAALSEQTIESLKLGCFAQKIQPDYLLEEGDRIEIYRQLTADPKEVRRQLALLGKSMGKSL